MKQTDLTIIILNFNGSKWLQQTLETLKKQYLDNSQHLIEAIVVDNNSTDDSKDMVKTHFNWVKWIQNNENLGFAAGNNVALKKAKSKYVMLLNSDMEFTKESNLDELIEYMESNHDVGIITPKLMLNKQEMDMASHRGEPTPWASFTYFAKLERLFPKVKLFSQYHQTYKNMDIIHDIDACSGAAMIVRNSAIQTVGYLDERFFMYAEDLDWCKRFREAGLRIVFYPKVVIIHHKNKSGIASQQKKTAQKTSHLFYDTMLQYYDKHYKNKYPASIRWLIKIVINYKKEH